MSRLLSAALAALLTLPGAARAADKPAPAAHEARPAEPRLGEVAPADVDAKTRAAIQRAVEKAKADLREEIRAELQTAQAATAFMGEVAPGPKLQFLELDGYFRVRGQLMDNWDLKAGTDAAGYDLFPVPLSRAANGQTGGTLTSANLRLRLEPTLNISEHVRVRSQIDVLDNYAMGSSGAWTYDVTHSTTPFTYLYGASRVTSSKDPTADRAAFQAKRVWAEVQTPVGLLSFGRMPSSWGLGILTNPGSGYNSDYGDTTDRIQFALPPLDTPVGKLTLVPILDFNYTGVQQPGRFGLGVGQPFDAEPDDDGHTWALKLLRLDTDDEIRRKLDAGGKSFNFGLYYNYETQAWVYPDWTTAGTSGDYTSTSARRNRIGQYAHVLDLWARLLAGRWRFETELVGTYGNLSDTFLYAADTTTGAVSRIDLGRVLIRQWGAVFQADYQVLSNKVLLGGELGIASGDSAPGFGNQPNRLTAGVTPTQQDPALPAYGSVDGPQYGQPGDRSIRNYQFNKAYNVDLILWRGILGAVTDAWYLRPKIKWSIVPGLDFDGAIIYSQALHGASTPSAVARGASGTDRYVLQQNGKKPLGVEVDGRLTLNAGNGFILFGESGVFQPLGGMGNASGITRAWAMNFGMIAKF